MVSQTDEQACIQTKHTDILVQTGRQTGRRSDTGQRVIRKARLSPQFSVQVS